MRRAALKAEKMVRQSVAVMAASSVADLALRMAETTAEMTAGHLAHLSVES